jgi:hypothetical protein
LVDPIKQLTFKYFGTQDMTNRLLPNADSVIADVNGLQILIVINSNFLNKYVISNPEIIFINIDAITYA